MRKIAFLFSGQGAQCVGMGKELYENNCVAREVFQMGETIRPGTLRQCFEGPEEILNQTENTQPALFLMDLACARALEAEGVRADMVAGFSLGEIPALAYGGILSDEEAFHLVSLRGEVMRECSLEVPGSMAAILRLEESIVEEICSHYDTIYPVNYNCPKQLSCAGSLEEIDLFCEEVKERGGRAVRLAVSGAFHTPYMEKVSKALGKSLDGMEINPPMIPMYSNYTGEPYPKEKEEIIHTIADQASHSVKWEQIIRNMAEEGIDTFIEVGEGQTLCKLVKKIIKGATVLNVCDMETLNRVVSSVNE